MLVIHIGSQKTGTTAIQGFLNTNQSLLKKRGVSYVSAGRKHIAHNPIVRPLLTGSGQEILTSIRDEISADPSCIHILSSEMFFRGRVGSILGAAFQDLNQEVKIVGYLRRPDAYAEAMYKQKVKNGRIDSNPQAFLKKFRNSLHYKGILDAFTRSFGSGTVCVRPFERAQLKSGDVVHDFLDQVGVDYADDFKRASSTSNKSLSRAVSEQLGLVNRHTSYNTKVMIREIVNEGDPDTLQSGDVFDLATRRQILNDVRDEMRSIAQEYNVGQENLFEEDDLAPDAIDTYPDAETLLRLERAASKAVFAAVGRQSKPSK